ncbi:GNAT family N-acetyltransferase (plasmid) [Halorussus salilacus]|uniref:GNAT family N-acetyltransferase n=1 Tax=Halorussus salilacus TaxID=2953750 RepID=UPI00209CF429|nr:GNAT family N-acetyltransferase [Halorussus salilacus]USZ69941.1 GNAT family N-acetyltransferase [Halorussus salilacus]
MDDPRIREAVADDAERLAEVYRSAYAENRRLGFPAKAGSATADDVSEWPRENRVFVAEVEEAVVGGVRLEVTDSERVKLSRLGVHEDWKGEGIGGRLLGFAEEVVREWGRDVVRLTTPEDHPFLPTSTGAAATRRRGRIRWTSASTTRLSWKSGCGSGVAPTAPSRPPAGGRPVGRPPTRRPPTCASRQRHLNTMPW